MRHFQENNISERDEQEIEVKVLKNASTVGSTIVGVTAGGCTKIAMRTVLLAAMLCQACRVTASTRVAYRSMS